MEEISEREIRQADSFLVIFEEMPQLHGQQGSDV